jgi:phosphatidylglycerophosphate synthase
MLTALVVYCGLCWTGRAPKLEAVKHNQLLGPFMAGYLVWLISPIERALVGRVSPNLITAISLFCCAATGVAAALGHFGTAVWMYALGGILDILDGRLARLADQQTKSGALFDSVSDRWAELFVFAGYAWYLHDTAWLFAVLAAMGSSLMVSYTRARAEGLGVDLSNSGMMQRAERILLITLGTLVAGWFAPHAVTILGVVMLLCAVTSFATAIGRWVAAYRALAELDAAVPAVKARPATPTKPDLVVVPAKPLRESAELAIR